ncbi:hypothetical protein THRCLA_21935 [Thraustotheca clavata]|uniref:EF-hand domain-containing protein n=1 Tax=Thraustotheca clavata TaxID=74557 RepID=A0A1V9ZHG3_9STRA|nr:hypothetical protein THRCLA_21935 [Thraustotheca clavata]
MLCAKVKYEYNPSTDRIVVLEGDDTRRLCEKPKDDMTPPFKTIHLRKQPKRGINTNYLSKSAEINNTTSSNCIANRGKYIQQRKPIQNYPQVERNRKSRETIAESTEAPTPKKELIWSHHRWLEKHGKESGMKLEREKMLLMRRWFDFLDMDGSGEIGLNELEDPLVSVGLAKCRNDVRKLIKTVDDSDVGAVNFEEFISMVHGKKKLKVRARYNLSDPKRIHDQRPLTERGRPRPNNLETLESPHKEQNKSVATDEEVNSVVKLFTDLQAGKLGDLTLPFPALITAYRRRMLLNAHMSADPGERSQGQSVLNALETTRREAVAYEAEVSRRHSKKTPTGLLSQVANLEREDMERRNLTSTSLLAPKLDGSPPPKLSLRLPQLFD